MPHEGRSYEWDEKQIDNPNEGSEFILLSPGQYDFEVVRFERGQFAGSEKTEPCKKAIIFLKIDGREQGVVEVKDDMILHSNFEWKLCQFFKAIGDRKSGEPLRMNWQTIAGKRGRCDIEHRNGTGQHADKKFNKVKRYLDPTTTSPPVGTPVSAPATEDNKAPWEQWQS